VNKRPVHRLATHLTLSADGRHLLLDGHVGNHWFVGVGDVAGGAVRILKEFPRHMNHGQFSPTDLDLSSSPRTGGTIRSAASTSRSTSGLG